jgi:cation-transporting ATPase E
MIKKKTVEVGKADRYIPKYNRGLSLYQVNKRESQGLINESKVHTNRSYWEIVLKNLFTFFNILLIVIGAVLISFGMWRSCIFLVILIFNLTIGLVQDIRSKRMVDKLSLINKRKVSVVRDGKEYLVDSSKLVLDDIIILRNDEQIPCDSLVVFGEIMVNESLLTGESVPQKKVEGSRLLSGTYVSSGRCFASVQAVGKENYIEKLQDKSRDFKTPKSAMFSALNKIFKIIGILVIILGIADTLQFGLLKYIDEHPLANWDSIYGRLKNNIIGQLAGALVSMIPSGMYLLTSTSLAVGVINLSKKKVIVQDMYAIETLARVDTLCIDKTGTITDGSMSVFSYEVLDGSVNNELFEAIMTSFNFGVNDGNFTAKALRKKFGIKNIFETEASLPFNSVVKYSSATLKNIGTITIGAYDYLPIKPDRSIEKKIEDYSKRGYRVLIVGFSKKPIYNEKIPQKQDIFAIIALEDNIRENAPETLARFQNNDVDIKVISGDSVLTVAEIAKNAGIKGYDKAISLQGLNDEEVKKAANEYKIFARVSPEQKELIVNELKNQKHVVAMFGDGVNDVLGLKAANVSISVKSAARAPRDISSLILTDDDFARLPEIISQGRRVINNLERTCSLFLVKTVFSIFLNIFFLFNGVATKLLVGEGVLRPFLPNSFYAWELITIGISAFFLALEPNNERVKGNFIKNVFRKAIPNGLIIGSLVAIFFVYSEITSFASNEAEARSICTRFISFASLFVLFEICFKFNGYRTIIFIGSFVAILLLFALSVFGGQGNNRLALYPDNPPRLMYGDDFIAIVVMIFTALALMSITLVVNRKIRAKLK